MALLWQAGRLPANTRRTLLLWGVARDKDGLGTHAPDRPGQYGVISG